MKAPQNAVASAEGTGTASVVVHYRQGGTPLFRITLTRDEMAFSLKVGVEEAEILAHAILYDIVELKRLMPAS
ncbi:MAG: hypothetical protein H0X07_00125 [Gemmatimonadales bacterium]|nr:hypothetical protein [Gemmatimonadales bacterium]